MLLGDGDAHGASGTGDDLLSGLDVVGIEVGHLDLGDLGELLLSELANLIALGNSGTALELELLLDQARILSAVILVIIAVIISVAAVIGRSLIFILKLLNCLGRRSGKLLVYSRHTKSIFDDLVQDT